MFFLFSVEKFSILFHGKLLVSFSIIFLLFFKSNAPVVIDFCGSLCDCEICNFLKKSSVWLLGKLRNSEENEILISLISFESPLVPKRVKIEKREERENEPVHF